MTLLRIDNLSKTFRGVDRPVPALDAISLHLDRHEFVTLVGPSGCGKSTLLRILVGIDAHDTGDILFEGKPVARPADRSPIFGHMPQRDALFPWRTVMQNLVLGPEINGESVAVARSQAEALLPLFGLDGFANAYPDTLSGGMRQRAALLRTYLIGREILLLDEPFGALDAITRRDLQRWLLEVGQNLQKTILFITHDIDEAIFLGDRVLVMSPRPGTITLDLPIPLARPRRPDMVTRPDFMQLKRLLLDQLEGGDPSQR